MTDIDLRGFRVAIVADELVNEDAAGFDVLATLERAGWGIALLPAAWYPDDVAGAQLTAIADQVHEYTRHGYALARVGDHPGLDAAVERVGVSLPEPLRPTSADQLTEALQQAASGLAPHDAAAAQRGA